MSPEYRGAPKSYLSITISRRDLGRLGLRTTFLAVVMGIARGFIASGTTRIRSTCRSPFSRLALLIWTWSASWKLRSKQKRGAIASSKTARRSRSPDVTMPDQSFPRRSQRPFHDPDKIIAALRRGHQTLDFERTDRSKQCKMALPQWCRSSRQNPLQFEAAPSTRTMFRSAVTVERDDIRSKR